jgi:hypothetical protein
MKHRILALVATCWFIANSPLAQAALFDFPALIDGSSGTITGTLANGAAFSGNPGEAAFQIFTWTEDGIALTATSTHVSGAETYAYLDSIDAGRHAGLGVCQNVSSGNQCTPTSDDNVTLGEILNTAFDQQVAIDFGTSTFRDADHYLFNPDIEVNVDSSGWAALDTSSMLIGSLFQFRTLDNSNQFYISTLAVSAVPEPSAYLLMGIGLLVIGFAGRKQLS